jgi:hypothetical protein
MTPPGFPNPATRITTNPDAGQTATRSRIGSGGVRNSHPVPTGFSADRQSQAR